LGFGISWSTLDGKTLTKTWRHCRAGCDSNDRWRA